MALSLDEALGMSLADEADESIHVDIDTRQVTIPESQQVFGVESDEDVEVKHIVIDGRYNDGTDLSTFTFRVNYQNANGDKGTYLATELKVNDDSIEFDWVIGRQVVAYKGTIAFIVCAYTIDSSSVIQNEWNSTLGKGTVLEGLEVSEFDFGDDIVRQLASILSDVNAAQASAKASADEAYKSKTEVVALGKAQQAAIEKKGKDTLATIPDDYTQVSNDVSQLKEDTAKLKDGKISKFYASSQGNTNLPDSDDGRIMDLKLYGKSEQKQYSGKNLLDLNLSTNQSIDDTGAIQDDTTRILSDFIRVTTDNYTASGHAGYELVAIAIYDENQKFTERFIIQDRSGSYTKQFTDGFVRLYYSKLDGTQDISKEELSRAMFEKGSTATAYEPYVGGIPSPNPEYPQEIKSVINPVVKVTSQNYLDYRNAADGFTAPLVLLKGEHYFTRFFLSSDVNINTKIQYFDDGTWTYITSTGSHMDGKMLVSDEVFGFGDKNVKITCLESVTIRIPFTSNVKIALNDYGYLDKYAEYQAPQTVTLPYTLNAIPVSSGGNVTIAGQQYIADYVDVEKGKLVRMVHAVSLTDTLTFAYESKTSSGYYRYNISDSVPNNSRYNSDLFPPITVDGWGVKAKALCSGFKSIKTTDSSNFNESGDSMGIFIEGNRGVVFQSAYTIDELKTKFPMRLLYALATPTETDLTADEIAAFKALVSHYPVTNVSTTSDQLDGYTVFNYPISLANGWNYVKQQLGDTRDYLYGIDLMTAEAYVNSEYSAALAEIEV